jgi:peroxiredoxin
MFVQFVTALCFCAGAYLCPAYSQEKEIQWSEREKPIVEQIRGLRKLPDDIRPQTTKNLALQIRQLPPDPNQLRLAVALANLATEGDPGHEVLQEVATTLAISVSKRPAPDEDGHPGYPYLELAQLVRYEHMETTLDVPQFAAAMKLLEDEDNDRQSADFTLTDLDGTPHRLKNLRGKVVLVNFWATWCPPCRKEMPDLEELSHRFKDQGLVVLSVSDEDVGKVKPFIANGHFSYPVLLDPGGKIAERFHVHGIPKTFVYDRDGKLVAQSIDMRTRQQFLAMLAQAGLH